MGVQVENPGTTTLRKILLYPGRVLHPWYTGPKYVHVVCSVYTTTTQVQTLLHSSPGDLKILEC